MKPAPVKIIRNVLVVKPNGDLTQESVILEGKHIKDVVSEIPAQLLLSQEGVEVFDGDGHILSPGLIDQHINGALGCDFNKGSITEIRDVLKQLPRFGITTILPTVITAAPSDMLRAAHTLEEVIHHERPGDTQVLGIHLEGPYLTKTYPGAHPVEFIPDEINMDELKPLVTPNLKLITLSPEADPSGEAITQLTQQGIRVSAGHSAATADEMYQAIACGVSSVTHLYNAMKPFHHRDPGIIGVALGDPSLFVELIADGIHVHPESIRMTLNAKGIGKTILVSDAMELAGLPQGTQAKFAGQQVTLEASNQVINESGQIAGSSALLDNGVRNLVQWDILPLEHALQLATQIPAQYLGESHRIGKIEAEFAADLVLWNKETLDIEATWIAGDIAYQASGTGQVANSMAE